MPRHCAQYNGLCGVLRLCCLTVPVFAVDRYAAVGGGWTNTANGTYVCVGALRLLCVDHKYILYTRIVAIGC